MRVRVIDVGPFDNDPAADFGRELDQADPRQRLLMVRRALEAVLDNEDADEDTIDQVQPRGVAAPAVVAAFCQGGPPAGATEPPGFLETTWSEEAPADLVGLALRVLDTIAHSGSDWAGMFDEAGTLEMLHEGLTS
jgi:hypothetical protein